MLIKLCDVVKNVIQNSLLVKGLHIIEFIRIVSYLLHNTANDLCFY